MFEGLKKKFDDAVFFKNVCKHCGEEFTIHQINGVCGDVSYAVKCGCIARGFDPYTVEEIGYFGIMNIIEENRIPTLSDRYDVYIKNIKTFFKNLLDINGSF